MLDLMNGHLIIGSTSISIDVYVADPVSGYDGQIIVNSTTNQIKIWYGSGWNVLGITITPAALSFLLLETEDTLLLETGDKLALEA